MIQWRLVIRYFVEQLLRQFLKVVRTDLDLKLFKRLGFLGLYFLLFIQNFFV